MDPHYTEAARAEQARRGQRENDALMAHDQRLTEEEDAAVQKRLAERDSTIVDRAVQMQQEELAQQEAAARRWKH